MAKSVARIILKPSILFWSLVLLSPLAIAEGPFEVSPELPEYKPAQLTEATINSVGSDSMGGLVDVWVNEYRQYQPDVAVRVLSRGSATAPAALIEGTADIGPMVRPMKEAELEEFKLKYGFEPTQIRTALAGVAVYVSKDNPLNSLTFEQLDAIYSVTNNRGLRKEVVTWGDLGAKGKLADEQIMRLGPDAHSYPYAFFRQQVTLQGDYHPAVTSTADVNSMLEAVAANPSAIGYGPIAGATDKVKILAIAKEGGDKPTLPTMSSLENGRYPLGRFLNVYFAHDPSVGLEPATKDFLRFVLSKKGQELVQAQGLIPLPATVVRTELQKLQ